MYRDAHAALDERDRAVGAILIGEALIASCEAAQALGEAGAPEAWRAIRDAHDDFPEIWRHLDRARHELSRRGVNVIGYDELRPRVRGRLATAADDADDVRVDPAALDDARRAAGELRMAVPGADWLEIERRTSGLVQAPLHRRRFHRLLAGTVIAGFAIAVVSWAAAIMPDHKPDRATAMRRELAAIAQHRRIEIIQLSSELGDRCAPYTAHLLAKDLVMDGRFDDARQLATVYIARCGDDSVMTKWAHAPHP
ncbi:MAG TPA: hypothetical protein VGC42_19985 [Kofleriaceae bacterium]